MKVKRMIELLSRYNPDAAVRFHTGSLMDLDVLSVYSKTGHNNPTLPQPPAEFVEVDLGLRPRRPS
jgi:hypothetical protein